MTDGPLEPSVPPASEPERAAPGAASPRLEERPTPPSPPTSEPLAAPTVPPLLPPASAVGPAAPPPSAPSSPAAAPPSRGRLGWVMFLFEKPAEPANFAVSRWLFLRAMGVVYLIAFVSLWTQADGLLGPRGILPVGDYLDLVAQHVGRERYWLLPSLSWLRPSDGLLNLQCGLGVGFAFLLFCGLGSRLAALALWALYLSLSTVGRDFLSFQWDALLLEAGLLTVFLAPSSWRPHGTAARPVAATMVWVTRFLLFKLMISSGLVKLLSGDPTWRDLTALRFHYETQPLPTWLGWHAHHLPDWFQQTSLALVFLVELGLSFLVFGPRRLPLLAAASTTGLMVVIALTGNYCFFNLLTAALCLWLVDDETWRRLLPASAAARVPNPRPWAAAGWRFRMTGALAGALLVLSGMAMLTRLMPWRALPEPVAQGLRLVAPLRTFNGYGLFAVMTTNRYEIVVEGSEDARSWLPYEFKWKPGDLTRRPGFVEPHQPRLDWQMWFAALGRVEQNPWFQAFLVRLLRGSPPVLALLERNPFPRRPPRHIRAVLYEYHLTTPAERQATGAWWRRQFVRLYCPPLSLRTPVKPPDSSGATQI